MYEYNTEKTSNKSKIADVCIRFLSSMQYLLYVPTLYTI